MPAITIEKLTETVGAEVLDVDVDRLLNDEDIPAAVMEALEQNGVLVFRELHIDDERQAAFAHRLGDVMQFSGFQHPEVIEISFDPDNPNKEYYKSNDYWHIDGFMDEIPAKASIMSGHAVTSEGGETEFASTYQAYDDLSDEEKQRYADLRVIHSFEAIQRLTYPDPTPEQLVEWERRGTREHPLVWTKRTGRRSLVFGASASHVVGMDMEEGRTLLKDLEERATGPDRVLSYTWTVGDMVIWDNRGLVHRARPFDKTKPRRMHRTTLVGDEAIQ